MDVKNLPRALLRRIVLWGLPQPEPWEQEFNELQDNAQELSLHSRFLLTKVRRIRTYMFEAKEKKNYWAFYMARDKIDRLLDGVESNSKYVEIATNRMTEILWENSQ